MSSGRIEIRRTSDHDIKIRDLYVSVDGEGEANLLFGKTAEFEVEPGEHTVEATNRLYTQKATIALEAGQRAVFEASNRASGCGAILFMVVGMGPYRVELRRLS